MTYHRSGSRELGRRRGYNLDKLGLVLNLERRAKPLRDWVLRIAHIDAESACWRMRQEHAAEQCMMLGLHSAALRQTLDAFGTPAAGAMKRQPMSAGLEPGSQPDTLLGTRVGAGDVGEEQSAQG